MIPKIQTIYDFQKVGEINIMPSTTIPGHDIDASTALDYISNNEPIPARFLSRSLTDEDLDGVLDSEARMYDQLDLLHKRSEREQYLFEKYSNTEVAKSAERLRQEREQKEDKAKAEEDLLNKSEAKEKQV